MSKPPAEIAAALDGADDETLRATIAYCEAQLASDDVDDEREPDREPPEEYDDEEWAEAVADVGAPTRATLTEKEINGNRYYYYQWSQDGSTRSEYVAPVTRSGD